MAGLIGFSFGAATTGYAMRHQPAHLPCLGIVAGGSAWALATTIVGVVSDLLDPRALLVLFPLSAVCATRVLSHAGAPRWAAAALACTQEPWPVVIRAGWWGGELTVTALLALSAVAFAMLSPGTARWHLGSIVACGVVVGVLALAWRSSRAARARIDRSPRIRLAAVVVDVAAPESARPDPLWPARSREYRDVEATISRYMPHVARAARAGARLIVLPEVVVSLVDDAARAVWMHAMRDLAG